MKRAWLVAAVAVASLTACVRGLNIPRPAGGPGGVVPPLPASRIDVPLSVDVRSALAQMETQVPRDIDQMGSWTMLSGTPVGIRYRVRRSTFAFEARNGALHAEATLQISVEACLGGTVPFIGVALPCQPVASCGIGEPPREVVVSTDTTLHLGADWRLTSQTAPGAPQFRNRCEVTALRIDVTSYVAQMVSERVVEATREVDRMIAARGDLRPRAETFWRTLQEPMSIGDGFWLAVHPESVRAAAISVDPQTLRTTVGITARPHVVSAAAAPSVVPPAPLPPLERGEGAPGFRVTLDATVPFAEATRMVAAQFRGRTLEMRGQAALVRDVRVEGRGAAILFALDVRFTAGQFTGTEGTLYLVGLPAYDPATGEIVVRELDYTIDTRDVLLRIADWMNQGPLREALARRARWPVRARIEEMRRRAAGALTRPLGGGATLRGSLAAVRPVGAYVTPAGITLRMEADGSAEVTQDLDAALAAPPAP